MTSPKGFTLVELLVVLAVMALLLSLALPRYAEHVDRARETVLRHNLQGLREVIDKFYADRGRYPKDLQELVQERYLREVPLDPITDRRDGWVVLPPAGNKDGGVYNVRSSAVGTSLEGTPYAGW